MGEQSWLNWSFYEGCQAISGLSMSSMGWQQGTDWAEQLPTVSQLLSMFVLQYLVHCYCMFTHQPSHHSLQQATSNIQCLSCFSHSILLSCKTGCRCSRLFSATLSRWAGFAKTKKNLTKQRKSPAWASAIQCPCTVRGRRTTGTCSWRCSCGLHSIYQQMNSFEVDTETVLERKNVALLTSKFSWWQVKNELFQASVFILVHNVKE